MAVLMLIGRKDFGQLKYLFEFFLTGDHHVVRV